MWSVARTNATARESELTAPDFEAALTHACAALALAYACRAATFASSWLDVPLLEAPPAEALPMLSVVVPARNEERSIERCVRSLLAQEWLDCEVIVVDDRSTDATPQILDALAREHPRLRVVRGAELPEGWIGKPWALVQGAREARGVWLLFTDADSVHAPRGAASVLRLAVRGGIDAISLGTGQEFGSFWERAVLPSILGTVLYVTGPLGDINDPRKPRKALANGQYIMLSHALYDALGGYERLRGEIAEDLAFARLVKADGRFRFVLAGGTTIASVRMYRAFSEIWAGFTKNVFVGGDGDVRVLAGGVAFLMGISVGPPVLAALALLRRRPLLASEALASTLAIIATTSWGLRRAGVARRLAFFAPLGNAVLAAIIVNSTLRVVTGRGVEWRGRLYSGRPQDGADLKAGA